MNEKRGPGRPPKVAEEQEEVSEPTVTMTQEQLDSLMAQAAQAGRDAAMEVSAERHSRDQEVRSEAVHEEYDDIWEEPLLLDATHIIPRVNMDQRWMRTVIDGVPDESNIARYLNKGWKPRQADTVLQGSMVPTVEFNGDNIIGVHDTILMERPKTIDDKHKAYERKLADSQMQAVESDMLKVHDSSSGMGRPMSSNKSSTSTGRVAPITPD